MGSYYRPAGPHHRDHQATLRKFSKQQFLQANCQFVVLDGHDYTIHKVDPDWPVDWDCIEEVRFKQSASSKTSCPICLDPPIAAKITKCGHIYCWPCMLHYLSLGDEKCRSQCPICFEPVYRGDLRSVVSHSFIDYSTEDEIILKLMVRKKGCVEVEPYYNESIANEKVYLDSTSSSSTSAQEQQSNDNNNDHYWSQANLVIVDSKTVLEKIVQRERDELLVKLAIDKDEPEICFVEQATRWLDKRVDRLHQQKVTSSTIHDSKSKSINQNEIMNDHSKDMPTTGNELSKNYLFYQCSDGQHIYLNPFSTKVLCHEYKSLENCPSEIKARILQMDWISMNEAWRKRFKYLAHLPLSCEFRLIEIDFDKSNLILPSTYETFEEQIKKRAQERQRRLREERKREKIIQVEQDRKIYGIQPSLKINLNNTDQFPSVSDERYLGLTQLKNNVISAADYDFSSDEDNAIPPQLLSDTSNNRISTPEVERQQQSNSISNSFPDNTTSITVAESSSTDVIPSVTLSFKDIQLQEAALQSAKQQQRSNQPAGGGGAWSSSKPNHSSSTKQSSSFAQCLVNAKTSQKEWTRNATSSNSTSNTNNNHNNNHPSSSSHQHNRHKQSESDDGGEELRAPPNQFRLSDFIDLDKSSPAAGGNGGGGGKRKGKSKKG